jgi:serine/threonine protein phosphatase PrpC/CRP-like cAMP-binding protein
VTYEHASRTDVGRTRTRNEDSFAEAPDIGLFVVADGMGGHKGGDEASRYACEAIVEHVRERMPLILSAASDPSPVRRSQVSRLLGEAIRSANDRIVLEAEQNPDLAGMGSTVVVVMLAADRAFMAHVGDSRVYLLRDRSSILLTEDHSLLFELIRQGRLTRQAAAKFPMKNVVTRALGMRGAVDADLLELPMLPGDRLLLCTDGLHSYIEDERLFRLAGEGPLGTVVERLIAFANAGGGADNITATLLEIGSVDADVTAARSLNDRLRSLPIFTGLTASEWVRLMAGCERRWFEPGEHLFREGDNGEGMYGVISGGIDILRGQRAVQHFEPGTHFGEMSLLEARPRLVSAMATEASEVFVLTRQQFDGMVANSPSIAARMLRQLVIQMARRLRQANDELVILRGILEGREEESPTIVDSDALVEVAEDEQSKESALQP